MTKRRRYAPDANLSRYVGLKLGCYTVIKITGRYSERHPTYRLYLVRCDCGAEYERPACRFPSMRATSNCMACMPRTAPVCRWCGASTESQRKGRRGSCTACSRSGGPTRNGRFPCGKPRRQFVSKAVVAEHNCDQCKPWRKSGDAPSKRPSADRYRVTLLTDGEQESLKGFIGMRCRVARRELGVSCRDLSKQFGMSPSWLRGVEAGEQWAPHWLIAVLCRETTRSVTWFYGGAEGSSVCG